MRQGHLLAPFLNTELEDQDFFFFTYNKVRKRKKKGKDGLIEQWKRIKSPDPHICDYLTYNRKNYYAVEMHGLLNKPCCINQT